MRTLAGSAKLRRGPAHQALRKQKAGTTGSRAGPGEHQVQSLYTRTKKMHQSRKEETLTWASALFPTHEGMESINWQAEKKSSSKQHPWRNSDAWPKFQPEIKESKFTVFKSWEEGSCSSTCPKPVSRIPVTWAPSTDSEKALLEVGSSATQ